MILHMLLGAIVFYLLVGLLFGTLYFHDARREPLPSRLAYAVFIGLLWIVCVVYDILQVGFWS